MRKLISLFVVLSIVLLSGCGVIQPRVIDVDLGLDDVALPVGSRFKVEPDLVFNRNHTQEDVDRVMAENSFKYESSDSKIAPVNEEGIVDFNEPGQAVITVSFGNLVKELPIRILAEGESIDEETNNNDYIVFTDQDFSNYLVDEVGIGFTPTFIFFEDGKMTFFMDGEMSLEQFTTLYENTHKTDDELRDIYKDYASSEESKELLDKAITHRGLDLYSKDLTTIDNNKINLSEMSDHVICVEVVQSGCSHCATQFKKYRNSILAEYPDMIFINYFIGDNSEQVYTFLDSIE